MPLHPSEASALGSFIRFRPRPVNIFLRKSRTFCNSINNLGVCEHFVNFILQSSYKCLIRRIDERRILGF